MAEPIRCDVHNLDHMADVLVTRMANGETFASCDAGYRERAAALAFDPAPPCAMHPDDHPADVVVAQLALGEQLALCSAGYLELARAMAAQVEADETDQAAAAALASAGEVDMSADPPTSAESSAEDAAAPVPPGNDTGGPASSEVDTDTPEEAIAAPGPS